MNYRVKGLSPDSPFCLELDCRLPDPQFLDPPPVSEYL